MRFTFLFNALLRKIIPIPSSWIIRRIRLYTNRYPLVLSVHDTIDEIEEGISISRFGDGEWNVALGKGIYFQPYDKLLARRLLEVSKIHGTTEFRVAIQKLKIGGDFSQRFWFFHLRQIVQHL
jgi:hypothetical protein